MHEQRPVLLEEGQHLLEVERRRLDGRLGALGDLAHALGEAALLLGILEQQAHDVGVDGVDRRLEHEVEHGVDRQRGRDGLADLVDRERVLEADVLVLQALAIEAALHDVHDLLDLERLEDVVVGAALHGLDGRLDGAEARHDDGQHGQALLGDLLDELEAAHVGHLEIRDHEVVAAAVQLLERLDAVLDRVDDVPLHVEEVGEDLADDLLVVDDEDARALGRARRLRRRVLGGHDLRLMLGGPVAEQGVATACSARAQEFPILTGSPPVPSE